MQRKVHASLQKPETLFREKIKYKKVHCILGFDQWKWLEPYIKCNTEKIIEGEKQWQRWKSILKNNQQCCIW